MSSYPLPWSLKNGVEERMVTLPETNIAHENPIFPGKYHQNGGFSMAMLVYRRVKQIFEFMMGFPGFFPEIFGAEKCNLGGYSRSPDSKGVKNTSGMATVHWVE